MNIGSTTSVLAAQRLPHARSARQWAVGKLNSSHHQHLSPHILVGPQHPVARLRHYIPRRRLVPCCVAQSPQSIDPQQPKTTPGRLSASSVERSYAPLSIPELSDLAKQRCEEYGTYGPESQVQSPEELAVRLRSSLTAGLDFEGEAVAQNRATWGANTLPTTKRLTFVQLLWEALQDVTLYALIASGAFSIITGQLLGGEDSQSGSLEGIAILGSVAVVVLVTAVNDYQKEAQFQELNSVKEDEQMRVIRGGLERTVSVFDLVVGDLLIVEGGDIVPVDIVITDGCPLKVDESHLTGEADEVMKDPAGDAVVFSGSKVTEGSARGLVIAVGSNSQSGVISMLTSPGAGSGETGEKEGMRKTTVLGEKLDDMAEKIGRLGLLAAVATTLLMSAEFVWDRLVVGDSGWSWAYLRDFLDFFISGITVLVVAVPEGLPLAVTIALAFSVKRMLAEKNLVRQLGACETMGCATTILTDKTGTLTQNRQTAVRLWVAGKERVITEASRLSCLASPSLRDLATFTFTEDLSQSLDSINTPPDDPNSLRALPLAIRHALCEGISLNTTASQVTLAGQEDGPPQWVGNRTEGALLELAHLAGGNISAIRSSYDTKCLLPFSSNRKLMGSLAIKKSGPLQGGTFHVKGAPDVLLANCIGMLMEDGSIAELSEADREKLKLPFDNGGLRVLCIAQRFFDEAPTDISATSSVISIEEDDMLHGLVLVGLIGIEDPVRPEVPGAVDDCHRAGITVRMLTGDNPTTGASIARQAGILTASDTSEYAVMRAQDFMDRVQRPDGSHDAALFAELWPQVRVLARCSPVHKYDIVKHLQGFQSETSIGGKHRREVLAMTGDGTNDAPALFAADVGFGMNSGTSIAKAASDIVIMDDSFASLVSALRWGRNVYISITKFLQFQLTINVVAVLITVLGAAVLDRPPLGAVQMLWVNLIMDSLASLALATEAPTDAMLNMPPFSADAPLLSNKVLKHIVGQAGYQVVPIPACLASSHHRNPFPHTTSCPAWC